MSVKKNNAITKLRESIDFNESKEVKIAWISSKNTLISAVIVAFISLVSLNLSEYIKKPSEFQNKPDENEIQYFKTAIAESNEQFEINEIELRESKEKLDAVISNEKDEILKSNYSTIKNKLESALKTNVITQKSFASYSNQSIEAMNKGERLNAALLRKLANEKAELANESIKSKYIEICEQNSFAGATKQLTFCLDYEDSLRRNTFEEVGVRSSAYEKPTIRGINNSDPKKTMDTITETYAENETEKFSKTEKKLSVSAATP